MYIKVTRHISPNLTVNHPHPMRFGPIQRRRTTYLFTEKYKTVRRRRPLAARAMDKVNSTKDTMPPPNNACPPQNEDPLSAALTELEHLCTLDDSGMISTDEKTPQAEPTRVTPGAPLSLSARNPSSKRRKRKRSLYYIGHIYPR